MNRSIKLLMLNDNIVRKLEEHHIYQVNHLINLDLENQGFTKEEAKAIFDAFEQYKKEELKKELRGRVSYFPPEYLNGKYSFGGLGLSLRAFNALSNSKISRVTELVSLIVNFEIYEIDNLGAKSVTQIMEKVKSIVEAEKLAATLTIYQNQHPYDNIIVQEMGFSDIMTAKLSELGFTSLGKLRKAYLSGKLGEAFNYKTLKTIIEMIAEYFSTLPDDEFYFFRLYLVENRLGRTTWGEIQKMAETDQALNLSDLRERMKTSQNLIMNEEEVRLPYFQEKIKSSHLKPESEAIMLARFSGMTLQAVANRYDKTRERIRQIVRDRLPQVSLFLEKALVKEYNKFIWHPEVFKKTYDIDELSFNVVRYLGNKFSFEEKAEFPEAYIKSLFDQNLVKPFPMSEFHALLPKLFLPKITIYGDTVDLMTRRQFLEYVIFHFIPKKGVHKSKIIVKANQVAMDNGLDYRFDKYMDIVTNTIQGLRYVRYYDYSLITEAAIQKLRGILREVDSVYSGTYFYRKHLDFMKTIDVRDGYELHFLLRRYFGKSKEFEGVIDFNRQPMLGIVGKLYSDVIVEHWKKLDGPIDIDKFINDLIYNYGYHSGTLINIINNTLGDYISLRVLYNQKPRLSSEVQKRIKNLLVDDFYELGELGRILERNGIKESDYQYFSNFWLKSMGYKTHDINYVIKEHFTSLKKLFYDKVLAEDIYHVTAKDHQMRETTLILFIETLREQYLAFPVKDEQLITMKYLETKGVTEKSLRDFVAALEAYLPKQTFFTYESLLRENYQKASPALKAIDKYHFDREMIVDLIRNVPGIKKTTKGDLFRIAKEPTIINEFVEELDKKLHFQNAEAMRVYVMENYGLNVKKFY